MPAPRIKIPVRCSEENLTLICDGLRSGKSLNVILTANPEALPNERTFWRWLERDEAARLEYARARQDQAEWYADRISELALQEPAHLMGEHGAAGVDGSEVAHRRLAIDALKWLAGKRSPLKYGDTPAQVNVGVAVNVPPIVIAMPAELAQKRRLLPDPKSGN